MHDKKGINNGFLGSAGKLTDPFLVWTLFQTTGDLNFYNTYKELTDGNGQNPE